MRDRQKGKELGGQAFDVHNFIYVTHVYATYRVTFFTGPTQKSSKYGTGPTQ